MTNADRTTIYNSIARYISDDSYKKPTDKFPAEIIEEAGRLLLDNAQVVVPANFHTYIMSAMDFAQRNPNYIDAHLCEILECAADMTKDFIKQLGLYHDYFCCSEYPEKAIIYLVHEDWTSTFAVIDAEGNVIDCPHEKEAFAEMNNNALLKTYYEDIVKVAKDAMCRCREELSQHDEIYGRC